MSCTILGNMFVQWEILNKKKILNLILNEFELKEQIEFIIKD